MTDEEFQPESDHAEPHHAQPRCCFHRSLVGEYLAMAVMIHAGFGAAAWAVEAWRVPAGLILVTAGIWVVARSTGLFSGRWFAPLVTAGVALAVFALWQADVTLSYLPLTLFSPLVFLAVLGVILTVDLVELAPSQALVSVESRLRRLNWHRLAVWTFALAFVVYLVVIPTAGWIIERMNPPKSGQLLEDMSLAEQVRLRSMEAITALWFFIFGATIGSFLNVVAYRAPRGESVVFKRSRCPQCGTQIKGRDNVPIFGWLLLGGRCRACQLAISARYPIVESIVAAMFLLLYFVELISGGANIPVRQPNHYHGVVWIIFYTKWDLIGLYLYHCFALSVLLAWALIDYDRQRVTLRARWGVTLLLFLPPLIWPDLLPVPLFSDAADWLQTPWLRMAITCLVGGFFGAALGWLTALGIDSSATLTDRWASRSQLASCLAIVGITLGWQATIAVFLFLLPLRWVAVAVAQWRGWSPPPATTLLPIAFVVQLAVWRWSVEYGAAWWPSHLTSLSGWAVLAIGSAVLLLMDRLLIQPRRDAAQIASAPAQLISQDETA